MQLYHLPFSVQSAGVTHLGWEGKDEKSRGNELSSGVTITGEQILHQNTNQHHPTGRRHHLELKIRQRPLQRIIKKPRPIHLLTHLIGMETCFANTAQPDDSKPAHSPSYMGNKLFPSTSWYDELLRSVINCMCREKIPGDEGGIFPARISRHDDVIGSSPRTFLISDFS